MRSEDRNAAGGPGPARPEAGEGGAGRTSPPRAVELKLPAGGFGLLREVGAPARLRGSQGVGNAENSEGAVGRLEGRLVGEPVRAAQGREARCGAHEGPARGRRSVRSG